MYTVNVQNLNKDYKIYAKPHDRLLEALLRKPRHNVFKVLEGISFNVGIGRSMGVIGDNGAGKSTLLKLLAGTVQPTSGAIEINGRIAALLELGAGFHPEFSGRQNIHLNASLLGISQAEIEEKEAEIIEFAELEQFIDRPVRNYSSGMYVRLAFSIATMVDPDILIIDEALSVGDIAFQKKCTRRMNRFREMGKTMLFCSHSMYHVKELCDHVIWLENGRIQKAGACDEVIAQYEEHCNRKKVNGDQEAGVHQVAEAPDKDCRIVSLAIKDLAGNDIGTTIDPKEVTVLEMEIEVMAEKALPNFGYCIMTQEEEILSTCFTRHDNVNCGPYRPGQKLTVRYVIDFLPLRFGSFKLYGGISDESGLLWYDLKIISPVTVTAGKGVGSIALKGAWEVVE